ncbi:cytochrome b560 subunit of succinate dehydrogenase [Aureobasidium namibiae CBS 147.97]|uniref:Cytochrome b560 subunit of succinate dehydrogenase n=1 Tax=Aureobasidium namibiae CBS 147.97 TaxID=1043004 RepID=A0A074WY76_9PEZI
MLAQRLGLQTARRLAVRQSSLLSSRAPQVLSSAALVQQRHAAFQSVSDSEASQQILAKQRLNRPVSPHLGIYKPQITWYGSALNRVTGVALSGTFYLFGLSYLIAPAFGWHLESASLAASFAAWPAALAILAKLVASFPFTYHSFNGLRHLMWDMGKGISNKQVQVTGWTVVGVSVVTSFILALI